MKPPRPPIMAPMIADCFGTFGPTPMRCKTKYVRTEPHASQESKGTLTNCPAERIASSTCSYKRCPVLPAEVANCAMRTLLLDLHKEACARSSCPITCLPELRCFVDDRIGGFIKENAHACGACGTIMTPGPLQQGLRDVHSQNWF